MCILKGRSYTERFMIGSMIIKIFSLKLEETLGKLAFACIHLLAFGLQAHYRGGLLCQSPQSSKTLGRSKVAGLLISLCGVFANLLPTLRPRVEDKANPLDIPGHLGSFFVDYDPESFLALYLSSCAQCQGYKATF